MSSESSQPKSMIHNAVAEFLHDLEGVNHAVQIACPIVQAASAKTRTKFEDFSEPFKKEASEEDSSPVFHVPFASDKEFRELRRRDAALRSALFQTPRALLVAMVSTYDAFLGRLLRSVYLLTPDQLNASERTFSFSELVSFGSIEAAREHMVSAEIESVLRKSHTEQFEYLEKRLAIPLRKGLDSWSTFVELTQRRNLFVHADGIVSRQYLKVCADAGVELKENLLGKRLHVGPAYFEKAFDCLYEIAVKLAHTIWRKLSPGDLQSADDSLNSTCYQLLETERYNLAHELLVFATTGQPRHSSAFRRRMLVINRAIAVKFGGIESAPWPLDTEDWSDCGDPFALAVAVLSDDLETATAVMRRIGPDHELVHPIAYGSWPLFRSFRETEEFRDTYKEIYGDEFTVTEDKTAEEASVDPDSRTETDEDGEDGGPQHLLA
ncbi:hypothetical protein RISK_000204 [Rhodopirellula islandica]|uniref:Uncharacterized protein n=1 Tax=Rhodopirellula islandica TaxID=595434 RepID=A0A0J1BMI3_RHOIS|nr:hypothetical protein [Rhodopirellula islandica]KLU07687.1 hypothetical protein RISK_000204 [Rhodopirellula islandica]